MLKYHNQAGSLIVAQVSHVTPEVEYINKYMFGCRKIPQKQKQEHQPILTNKTGDLDYDQLYIRIFQTKPMRLDK